ncbi:unnamed protein product [Penicillium salamii]|uniref:Uncharacterized protein n=1 Tax=Penicillium salamii TaxID=1612424 RepID=A0A9W4NY10_9EURO|nr:unnamed protein product [Penicillium salamii]
MDDIGTKTIKISNFPPSASSNANTYWSFSMKIAYLDSEPHSFLRNLVQQSFTFKSRLLSVEDLHSLQIRVRQVDLCPQDGVTLQFEPCFFRPPPDKLLEKYPIHPDVDEVIYEVPYLEPIRTLQDFIDDALTEHSPEFAPVVAKAEYEMLQRDSAYTACPDGVSEYAWEEFDPEEHTFYVAIYLENHPRVPRQGPFDGFNLDYLGKQSQTRCVLNEDDLPLSCPLVGPEGGIRWEVCKLTRFIGLPHSFVVCSTSLHVTDARQSITSNELRIIVRVLLSRVTHAPFDGSQLYPVNAFYLIRWVSRSSHSPILN